MLIYIIMRDLLLDRFKRLKKINIFKKGEIEF